MNDMDAGKKKHTIEEKKIQFDEIINDDLKTERPLIRINWNNKSTTNVKDKSSLSSSLNSILECQWFNSFLLN